MNRDNFYLPYPWARYSKKLANKIDHPQFVGSFRPDPESTLRLVIGRETTLSDTIALYWLVDETDGIIADIRYQVFGASALIGALESACQLLLRKNYDQAKRITADLIDRELRDKPDTEAFPPEVYPHLNLVLSAIENASEQCTDIPFDEVYTASPLHPENSTSTLYPNFDTLPKSAQIAVIEDIIQKEIRPYIELDAGGIQIIDLSPAFELTIAYQGSCTSCHSATGSTLNAIQQILQSRVHPSLFVTPDLSFLKTE